MAGRKSRKRRARQARQAALLQLAVVSILCGLTAIAVGIDSGAQYGHKVVGDPGVQHFCFNDDPPPGVAKCHGDPSKFMPPEIQE